MKLQTICALLLLSVSSWVLAAGSGPVVTVSGGQVQGRSLNSAGAAFKGIPYAAPPLGKLRWHEPVPAVAWKGVRDAAAFGPACVQEIRDWNRQEAVGNQEDCLYLNVWTPEWPIKSKLPVMFWIYGGGNTEGAASVDYFDGASLAHRGVVLVTFNYRMGVFGFFAHPELTAESPHHSSGNYGLLDQLAALKWVRDNIAQFGGDPDNITVFGQSAGGADTSFLLASPLSQGLFARAIQESGGPIRDMTSLEDAQSAGEHFAASLHAPAKDVLKFLRSLPADQLQKAAVAAQGADRPNMTPSIDGWYLPTAAERLFAGGKEHAVPLMIGSNSQEMGGPAAGDALRKAVSEAYGINAGKALMLYGLTAGGEGDSDPVYGPVSKQLSADGRQRCGAVQEALWHASVAAVYEYQFDRAIPNRPTTGHSAELPYVFGNLLPGGFLGGAYGEIDRKISDDMQIYWTNFARSGDPNGGSLPQWAKFDPKARAYLEFTDKSPVPAAGLRRQACDLWMENLQYHMMGR